MVLEKTPESPLDRSSQSILKEINSEYSLEGLMLKLKLQYFGHLMWRVNSLEKTDTGKDWGQEEKGVTEDEMVGWHHWLNGCEFELTLGVSEEQERLVCCSLWGHKESDMTKQLNNNNMCCILDNVPWPLEKNVYSVAFRWNVPYISIKSILSNS